MAPTAAEEVLAPAIEAHKEGRLDDAATVYRQVLATEPDHADALHLLGVVAHPVPWTQVCLTRRA